MNILQYYRIRRKVTFVNVELDGDNRLFLDPERIRRSKGYPDVKALALECLESFAGALVETTLGAGSGGVDGPEGLLGGFREPWETRLGLSKVGFYGHGGASKTGTAIAETLAGEVKALVRMGVLGRLEELPLFVKGVANDITSDITSRVVYLALAQFTEEKLAEFPEFSANGDSPQIFRRRVWLPELRCWGEKDVLLPVASGKPVLLIPSGWVGESLLMSARRYHRTTVLSYVQLEEAAYTSDGSVLKTPKNVLRERPDLRDIHVTNREVTIRAFEAGDNLPGDFRGFVDRQFSKNSKKKNRKKKG